MKQRSALVLLLAAAWAGPARADFKVWTPDVNPGEIALESVGDYGHDIQRAKSGEQSYTQELEYGVTNWWQTELELEFNRAPGPGNTTDYSQLTTENLFQFTERGEYWMDAGFFFEYGQSSHAPNETTFGPVLRKEFLGTINSVNLFVQKDIGRYAEGRPAFVYAWETRLDLGTAIEPGFQAYGTPGPFGHFAPLGQQDHRIGPQLFGTVEKIGPGSLSWNGGVLFGLTPAAPRLTLRWQAEYELHF
ncbi:MAG TPA: hypothetical protein VN802_20115 [Stellaceae bacterium]|nr:hypothetical protein [Stellaceae bacterium]